MFIQNQIFNRDWTRRNAYCRSNLTKQTSFIILFACDMTFKTEIGITEEKTAKIHVYLHFRCNLSYFFNKKNFSCYYDVFDMIQYISVYHMFSPICEGYHYQS